MAAVHPCHGPGVTGAAAAAARIRQEGPFRGPDTRIEARGVRGSRQGRLAVHEPELLLEQAETPCMHSSKISSNITIGL